MCLTPPHSASSFWPLWSNRFQNCSAPLPTFKLSLTQLKTGVQIRVPALFKCIVLKLRAVSEKHGYGFESFTLSFKKNFGPWAVTIDWFSN